MVTSAQSRDRRALRTPPRWCRQYRVLFVAVVLSGALVEASSAQRFADMAFLSLAFPNVLGLYLLAPIVRRRLDEYRQRR